MTRIRAWFGLRPRSLADSVSAAVSPPKACAVKDGTFCDSATRRSGWPMDSRALASSTTTGAGLSCAVMPVVRVPVTMMMSSFGAGAL